VSPAVGEDVGRGVADGPGDEVLSVAGSTRGITFAEEGVGDADGRGVGDADGKGVGDADGKGVGASVGAGLAEATGAAATQM